MLDVEREQLMIVAKSPAKLYQLIVSSSRFECFNENNWSVILQKQVANLRGTQFVIHGLQHHHEFL